MVDTTNSLSGISTGIDTTALINAIVAMKGGNVTRMKSQADLNDKKSTALAAMRTSLQALALSVTMLYDKLNNRTVTSTDTNNTYATATASGVAAGNYDIKVNTVATKGRISATLDTEGLATNLAVASATDTTIFSGTTAKFAIQGTDGKVAVITLDATNNSINGLRDKINQQTGTGVTAAVVNMGKGTNRYQLVLTAKETGTGTGTTTGNITIADITNMGGDMTAVNSLGILAGAVDSLATPTSISNGLTSTMSGAVATDANFILNGVELTRAANVVSDAAEGMTFTLKQGNQSTTTTLTVAADKGGASLALQEFITKYNQLLKDYKAAATSTKNADGSVNQGPLANDSSTRALMASLKSTLLGASAGMPGASPYKNLASVGVSSLADGGLYLNSATFQTAVVNDLSAVKRLFAFVGESTSQSVALKSAGGSGLTGSIGFDITKDGTTGVLSGILTKYNDVGAVVSTSTALVVGSDGTLVGTGDFAGLTLTVSGAGSGKLSLTQGAVRAAADLLTTFTGTTGALSNTLNSIVLQNKNLATQIGMAQSRLDREKETLKAKFAQMEAIVGRMRSSAGSLAGL